MIAAALIAVATILAFVALIVGSLVLGVYALVRLELAWRTRNRYLKTRVWSGAGKYQ